MTKKGFFGRGINPGELAFDCALLIFPFLLEELYDQVMALNIFGVSFAVIFFTAAVYFMPLLIGRMYNEDFRDSPPRTRKIVPWVLFSSLIFIYGNLLNLLLPSLKGDTKDDASFVMVTATVFLIMGPIAGLMFTGKGAEVMKGASARVTVFLITLGFLPMFYILLSGERIFGNTGFLAGMLIVVLIMIGDVLFIIGVFFAYKKTRDMAVRAGVHEGFVRAVRIATPFCVSFMLVFFNIHSDRLFTGIGLRGPGYAALAFALYVLSGVLPLRLLMMLTPPVRPLHVVMGTISAAVMIAVLLTR